MTFLEAAGLAKQAEVGELWLTHYSPSMNRPDEYLEEISAQIDAFYANDRKTEEETEKGTCGYPNIIEFRSKEKSPKPSTVRAFS